MESLALVVALAAVIGLALVVWQLREVRADLARARGQQTATDTATQLTTLQQTLQGQLQSVQQAVTSQVGETRQALISVSERLGGLSEQSREIADLARDVAKLEDLLRPPTLRGGFGELMLERLLEDIVPGRFERQYEFPSTHTRVDAVVMIGDKLVPIDAKFPLEMFAELTAASGDERKAKRRAFINNVRSHVDAVADKYIVPRDRTIDFAFLYIPSENVYYELCVREADDGFDLRAYCQERHVLPVSPNTLQAFLFAVLLGLRGMAIQESAKEIQRHLGQLGQELARLEADHQKLGRHLDNARQVHDTTTREITRLGEGLRQASASAVAEPASQPTLPLDGGDDET